MNKTKLGISTNLYAFIAIFVTLWSGLIPALLVTGYALIKEEDIWLKKTVTKGLIVVLLFSLATALIGFLPNIIDLINDIFNLWSGYFDIRILNAVARLFNTILNIAEKVIMLLMALFALKGKWFNLGFVDKFIVKHFE
ncbi:MAG: hypothetical protein J6B08_05045 [Ruminiclostridium sp.]|nr:hypothetical protein [Ruminiclostridium sp.]